MIEERPIKGFEGYAVRSDGTIISYVKGNAKELRQSKTKSGYMKLTLGARNYRMVHRLVAEAFHGPCPEGYECSHLDGDRANNKAENLAWETKKENHARKKEHGTYQEGLKHHATKFNESDLVFIKEQLAKGMHYKKLAANLGVAQTTIWRIQHGKRYT